MTPFKSTAEFYSRFRVPYPESLVSGLKADADLSDDAQVLDLATGPGRLALALAPSLPAGALSRGARGGTPRKNIVAVDVETEMLEEGKRVARRKGVANVQWIHSRAEDLTVAPGTLDLVTIGEAFHRLDQDVVLRRIRQWLKVGA